MPPPASAPPLVIQAQTGWRVSPGLSELWHYRDLVALLALRDLRVRYKQSVLGAAWALLQPLLTLAMFSGLFGLLLGRDRLPTTPGHSYALSTFCALVPWQLFARAVTGGGESIVANQALVTKVYFPRLALPLACVLAGLVDFAIAAVVLGAMLAWQGVAPGGGALLLPLLVLLTLGASLGVALWLSAANALYRDVRVALPFLVQFGMIATPVVYSAQSVLQGRQAWVATLYGLNPMTGIVEGFRYALLGGAEAPTELVASAILVTLLLLTSGLWFFRRLEPRFADLV